MVNEEVVEVKGVLLGDRTPSKTLNNLFERLRKLRTKESELLEAIFKRLEVEPESALPPDLFPEAILGEEVLDPE